MQHRCSLPESRMGCRSAVAGQASFSASIRPAFALYSGLPPDIGPVAVFGDESSRESVAPSRLRFAERNSAK